MLRGPRAARGAIAPAGNAATRSRRPARSSAGLFTCWVCGLVWLSLAQLLVLVRASLRGEFGVLRSIWPSWWVVITPPLLPGEPLGAEAGDPPPTATSSEEVEEAAAEAEVVPMARVTALRLSGAKMANSASAIII